MSSDKQCVGIVCMKEMNKCQLCHIQRSAKRLVRGCEKFVPALVYLFCLALPGSCLARFAHFLAGLCMFNPIFVSLSKSTCLEGFPFCVTRFHRSSNIDTELFLYAVS